MQKQIITSYTLEVFYFHPIERADGLMSTEGIRSPAHL